MTKRKTTKKTREVAVRGERPWVYQPEKAEARVVKVGIVRGKEGDVFIDLGLSIDDPTGLPELRIADEARRTTREACDQGWCLSVPKSLKTPVVSAAATYVEWRLDVVPDETSVTVGTPRAPLRIEGSVRSAHVSVHYPALEEGDTSLVVTVRMEHDRAVLAQVCQLLADEAWVYISHDPAQASLPLDSKAGATLVRGMQDVMRQEGATSMRIVHIERGSAGAEASAP